MKKLLSLYLITLGLFVSCPNTSSAEDVSWWGEYCTENKEVCVHINNVDVNHMGIAHFRASFVDNQDTEICNIVAVMDNLESRNAGGMFYDITLSADNSTIVIQQNPNMEAISDDGCTTALFDTYTTTTPPQTAEDVCPSMYSDPKMATVTVKKIFEAHNASYMTFDNNGTEETIQIEYGNKDLYEQFVGKTVQMDYWDVQYFDEHDGECVQTKDVNTLDNVGIPKG